MEKMDHIFNAQFKLELLQSERLRLKILCCIFCVASLFPGINFFFLNDNYSEEFKRQSLFYIFIFLLAAALFEFLCLLYITRQIKKKLQGIPVFRQYLNGLVEISSPAVIMLLLSSQYHTPVKVLQLPAVYIYFVFIILSTLSLNFTLTFLTGVFAAVEFFLLSNYLLHKTSLIEITRASRLEYMIAFGKSVILLFSGIGAAFVARQVRRSIDRTLQATEKENKIVNLFGQQISKEIVDEMMKSNGIIQSKLMEVCIMFIDIRNFTNYVVGKSPEEIVQYQNVFFSIVVDAVTLHKGIVNQFLGDGCMITFGAPLALENSCEHAVHAALKIRNRLNQEATQNNTPAIKIGVGIHIGSAVTGNIGTSKRQQYSITGSVVIIAARIEQLNKEFHSEILISQNVMERISSALSPRATFINNVQLKGWNQPVGIYKID